MVNWYEKTVEYAFARKFLEVAAMPLSGTAEKIGDTMFYDGNSFYIIEFKRGWNISEEIDSERGKYSNVESSIEKLTKKVANKSHYVVFGSLEDNKFELYSTYYIDFLNGCCDNWKLSSLQTNFSPIDELDCLREYLQLLINEKKPSSKDSSSVDYGNILIVDRDGNACTLSDKDGLSELKLDFQKNEQTQKNTHSSQSMGLR